MLTFFIFLITDLFLVLLVWACCRNYDVYRQGMLFGIHIPSDALNHPDVLMLQASAKKTWNRFTIRHLILGSAVCFAALWNFAISFILWSVWLVIYIAGLLYYTTNPLRKMYALKQKNGWFQEQSGQLVRIDTTASAYASEKTPGFLWHLAILGVQLAPVILYFLKSDLPSPLALSLSVTACGLSLAFLSLHFFLTKTKNTVYSEDSSLNLAINQLEKSTWAKSLLASDSLNAVSFLYLFIRICSIDNLYDADWVIFTLLQLGTILAFIIPVSSLFKKKKELLATDPSPIVTDDDVYWKSGFYCNPNDPHLLVQGRLYETNYTFNMAHPAGKIITFLCYGLGIFALLFCIYLCIPLISIQLDFSQNGNQISISEGGYHCKFSIQDIKSASLLNEMPDGRFFRVDGVSTDHYDIGNYKNRNLGKCMLFLEGDYSPILEINLEDKTIFLNSKISGDVEKWYQILQK